MNRKITYLNSIKLIKLAWQLDALRKWTAKWNCHLVCYFFVLCSVKKKQIKNVYLFRD